MLGWIAVSNMGENLVYYWKPSEMLAQGSLAYEATIRLGGVVVPGSVHWDEAETSLTFELADTHQPEAKKVKVESSQQPPQLFREGIGVVLEGTFQKRQVFVASRLMVNHSNEYRAPHDGGEPPKNWKKTLTPMPEVL